ncbi:hypothetical protein LRS74_13215 [Streptomyces sp. LX-29]|uniref:DUF6571 family protein n=1 Tax=Streptomyces sp. LX-29 TaxID=2900152 RepID=UPI00240D37AE|nr:DUF6571 family protein [Streptomyces sp. LX-29]WFB07902.1 hypothetical protein LRS74_13215 [Streptomyces sp. LX-29]
MTGLTFDSLYHVSLSSLASSVHDWQAMMKQLDTLATDASEGMARKAEAARWEGVNSDVTRPFIRKTAKEFRDAHTEATSIWAVLRDAHADLAELQKTLKKLIDEDAKTAGIRVIGRDDGTVSCALLREAGQNDDPSPADRDKLGQWEGRINRLIAEAQEIDDSVVRALRKSHGRDNHNFGHARYDSLDDAQAEQAIHLARKSLAAYENGEKPTRKELTRLRDLLAHNHDDPEFAVDFYKTLGPRDALLFEAQIASDASAHGDATQLKLARSIQDGMGETLATATRPHTEDRSTSFRESKDYLGRPWLTELQRVGRERLNPAVWHGQARVTGYQVLATLLRHGEYDKRFLVPLGRDMVTFEREQDGRWPVPDSNSGGRTRFDLNLDKEGGPGWDPMTGLLEALGHSPEASTAFFHGSTGGGDSDLEKISNLDYFLGDADGEGGRDWISDKFNGLQQPDEESKVPAKDALGHALESAVSGRPYGSGGPLLNHTDEQAELFRSVVERLGDNSDLIKPDGELAPIADSLGNMSAEYVRDIDRVFAGGDDNDYFWHDGAIADLSDLGGKRGELHEFLHAVAQDPNAYSSITHAQQAVATEAMQKAIVTREDVDLNDVAPVAGKPVATLYGIVADGRADAIAASDNSVEKIREYNEKLGTGSEWAAFILERAAEPIAQRTPIVGEAMGWTIGAVKDAVVGHYSMNEEQAAKEIERDRVKFVNWQGEELAQATKQAFLNAAEREGLDLESRAVETAAADVYQEAVDSYTNGKGRV